MNSPHPTAVAIGGVGGSGTRLVADMLRVLGVHIGDDLNTSTDTLWFSLLFKRLEILQSDGAEFRRLAQLLEAGLRGGRALNPKDLALLDSLSRHARPMHSEKWLQARVRSLAESAGKAPYHGPWGWKEPNTHVLIERFWQLWPRLKYIHVVRHGLDMALSANQNQLKLWGPHFLGEAGPYTTARSLRYWCRVHQRMQALHLNNPNRMYWLDYDALCEQPHREAADLCDFLATDVTPLGPLLDTIRKQGPPRHLSEPLNSYCRPDIEYVRSLGYAIP